MANEMKLKLRAKKKLLAEYEEHSYYYIMDEKDKTFSPIPPLISDI
ncbi:hypothetical protein BCL69_11281 [Nitrosomonas communis]|uniref:Uncharacterized protein n=1 Tax=Nitrosomonas communis TaxID=44574 RepID=A0A5D3YAY2_9PROT|nr:hypothetical protein BCL69_11281 [Nitrosomonas communis]